MRFFYKVVLLIAWTIFFYNIISVFENKFTDVTDESLSCNCALQPTADFTALPGTLTNESTCSKEANVHGAHQKVVSFSFYGKMHSSRNYFQGIQNNVELVTQLYPGWLMRVYHNISDVRGQRVLYGLQCKYEDILNFCYVGNLPVYGNIKGSQPNMWRFLALSDPSVDVVLSRDLDSVVSEREVAAVSEWLQSPAQLHVMRDHTLHDVKFLGMYTLKMDRMCEEKK